MGAFFRHAALSDHAWSFGPEQGQLECHGARGVGELRGGGVRVGPSHRRAQFQSLISGKPRVMTPQHSHWVGRTPLLPSAKHLASHLSCSPPISNQPLMICFLLFRLFVDLIYLILNSHLPFNIEQYIDTSFGYCCNFLFPFNYCGVFIYPYSFLFCCCCFFLGVTNSPPML